MRAGSRPTVLFVGLGSIGQRHLRNFKQLCPLGDATVLRHRKSHYIDAEALADQVVYSLDEAIGIKPDIAFITSPAPFHIPVAIALAQHNVHLFIEKPISNELVGVNELIDICKRQSLTLMVGYNLRFNSTLQALKQALIDGRIGRPLSLRSEVGQYLPDWRPECDYRQSVSARSDLGGGVVLELSHEIDYARWLMGEVEAVYGSLVRISELEIDVEDTAEIILHFQSGAIGNVHLDMIQRQPVRNCRISGTEGTLYWDGIANRAWMYSVKQGEQTLAFTTTNRNEMYLAEMSYFLDCVAGRTGPAVTGEEGRRVLEIALAIKQSTQERRVIFI